MLDARCEWVNREGTGAKNRFDHGDRLANEPSWQWPCDCRGELLVLRMLE
jgi:hypothetical protein